MPFLSQPSVLKVGVPEVSIHFDAAVLGHFERNRQSSFWSRESGGQLFATIRGPEWTVVRATGPRVSDFRRRFRFFPSRRDEQIEIERLFREGLHYVGDWHTHPESRPTPSYMDLHSMDEMVRRSVHELPGFLMVIVGTELSGHGLWISFHSKSGKSERVYLEPDAQLTSNHT
ncbi:Mov34/MPN/PAD-1 family protein [Rhodomicrobium sp. Az07]|uniref:Mov34/MPN/PAD-1 family protein n=1 Tax=Rhodomicrobium sp. Az07 TaxID=2839034 RepID=UPI001BEAD07E|nr:Mov34/MPN/PAD-1 family protein [Rhodomicrobium sp. Az07]